jgi:hypothetical protein
LDLSRFTAFCGAGGRSKGEDAIAREEPAFRRKTEMTLPSFPHIDQFSAGINALNGVLVARHPSHNRGYTVAGLLIMSFFGGIGGGISRDVPLNEIPSPLKDPTYFFICLLMGLLGLAIYRYADSREEQFRTRTLAFFKSFSLPWFAILGAHKALEQDLGFFAAIHWPQIVPLAAPAEGPRLEREPALKKTAV